MKNVLIASAGLILSLTSFAQAKKKSPLDGRIYTITLTSEGEKKAQPIKDEASFAAGKFKSNFLMQAGFMQSDYEYEIDSASADQVIKFTVEAKNENQERFSWEGILDGSSITGTAVIRKKGKVQRSYTISGSWKNKKKDKPAVKTEPPAGITEDSLKSKQ